MSHRVRLGAVVCVVLLTLATPAWAHTGLVSSSPSADASVDGSVDELTLTFSQPIELAGTGVEVLDETGDAVDVAAAVDDEIVTVRPQRPLDGGTYGVRWAVRAGDAHPVRGTLAFTVVTAAVRARSSRGVTGAPRIGSADSLARAATPTLHGAMAPAQAVDGGPDAHRATSPLAAALAEDPVRDIRRLDQGLRAVFWLAALGAVGVLVFLVGVWDGHRREVRRLTRLCARLAAVTALVVPLQVVVRSARTAGGWSAALTDLPGTLSGDYAIGTAMRLAGAVLLAGGLGAPRRSLSGAIAPIAGGAVDLRPAPPAVAPAAPSAARRMRSATVAILGALLLIGSFAFVGHAATATPRAVSIAAVVAHTAAAATWGGGLLALLVTLSARRRMGMPLRAGLIATRFSVAATIGVMGAAAAGVALAAVRLDDITALWSSAYGLVLVAKVAVVGVIGAIGAVNHFVLVPHLRTDPDHRARDHLRRLGLVEVTLLVVVAALTSALVGLAG